MKKRSFFVSLAIIAILNIGILVIVDDYSGIFWINYCFIMIALLFTTYKLSFGGSTDDLNNTLNKSIPISLYLIFELIAGLVCSKANSETLVLVVHLAIVGVFIVLYNITISANDAVSVQQDKRKVELRNFKRVIERIKLIQADTPYSAEYKKALDRVYDVLRSGQTESNNEVEPIENEISSSIDELEKAVLENDSQKISTICHDIEKLAVNRNSLLKTRENF